MGVSPPLILSGQEQQLGILQARHSFIPHQLDFFNLPAINHFLITTGLLLPKYKRLWALQHTSNGSYELQCLSIPSSSICTILMPPCAMGKAHCFPPAFHTPLHKLKA